MAFPQVPLRGTQLRTIGSSNTARTYEIFVKLPDGYAGSDSHYPTLYVLDGQWDFKLLDSVCGGLVLDRVVPEMIVVGISYAGDDPDFGALRARDYTPVDREGNGRFGGAAAFLRFLSDELIPFVEREYRSDPADRAIGGSSFGGLFTFFALFHAPDLFARHISISPAIGACEEEVTGYEEALAAARRDLPVRLFVAVGGREDTEHMLAPTQRMMDRLRGRSYAGLAMTFITIEGEGHSGVKPEAYNRGLRAVFEDALADHPAR